MTDSPVLSPSRQKLADLMERIQFGRIEGLFVADGEPLFDPAPRVRRLHVFGKPSNRPQSRPREECTARRLEELFELFDQEGSFVADELIVDSGLPVRLIMRDVVRD